MYLAKPQTPVRSDSKVDVVPLPQLTFLKPTKTRSSRKLSATWVVEGDRLTCKWVTED